MLHFLQLERINNPLLLQKSAIFGTFYRMCHAVPRP